MPEAIIYNGNLLSSQSFGLSFQNRAFRYGDGFFETIRCTGGTPLWLDRHFQRIQQAAATLKINLHEKFTLDTLKTHIESLLFSNHHMQGARVRLSMYRGDGGFYTPTDNNGHFLIESLEVLHKEYKLNIEGKLMGVFTDLHKPVNDLSYIKSINAQLFVMASLYTHEMKWNDCFILNTQGNIAEATSSNVFVVKNNKIYTPSTDQGCVKGVMKSVIIELAAKIKMEVIEGTITPDDLIDAEEVFLTNTIQGIQWVKGFKHRRYYHNISGELLQYVNKKVEADYPDLQV